MTLKPLCALGSTYEGINGGVHRRTASVVGIPSLIRHAGFWDVAEASDVDRRSKAFVDYLANLTSVLNDKTKKFIHVTDAGKDLPGPMLLTEVRSGTIRIARFWWHGIRATIRIEFRTEYVMITSILDLSVIPCAEYAVPDDPKDPQRLVGAKFKRLGELFNASTASPSASRQREKAPAEATQAEYCEMASYLQYGVWKRFEETILDAKQQGQAILGSVFGEVFADFRGIVTGSTAQWVPAGEEDPAKRKMEQAWRTHFEMQPHGARTRQLEHGSPPHGWARDTLRRLWPLIEPDRYLHEYEFTVSGFLAGRALFVTALGPKLPDHIDCGWEWTPVCNFIHCYTDDVWQLGRLVDRIKNLGTLRLAATVQIEPLIDAGATVDELTAAMRAAEVAIQDEINRKTAPAARPGRNSAPAQTTSGGTAEAGSVAPAGPERLSPDKAMDAVRKKYKEINEHVSSDIMYRLERAEYYIEQFTKGAAALRVKRIEGFQKYDEMVARRMSSVFSYIQLMRNRMIDVDARMSALSRAYTSLKAVETTKDIQDLVMTMNGLVSSMENQDKQIKQIQESGEVALIGFLIPYYVGSTFIHYAFHLEDAAATRPWLLTITFFAVIIIARSLFKMLRERNVWNSAGLTFLISLFYIFFIWLVLPPLLAGSTHPPAGSLPNGVGNGAVANDASPPTLSNGASPHPPE